MTRTATEQDLPSSQIKRRGLPSSQIKRRGLPASQSKRLANQLASQISTLVTPCQLAKTILLVIFLSLIITFSSH